MSILYHLNEMFTVARDCKCVLETRYYLGAALLQRTICPSQCNGSMYVCDTRSAPGKLSHVIYGCVRVDLIPLAKTNAQLIRHSTNKYICIYRHRRLWHRQAKSTYQIDSERTRRGEWLETGK